MPMFTPLDWTPPASATVQALACPARRASGGIQPTARRCRLLSPTSWSSGATTSAVQPQRLQPGMMGYKTPNIDRIAKEGALFTDWYGQQSCTAGRAAFITGQSPLRTGLTKVGLPGAPEGLKKARRRPSPTLLKAAGLRPASSARTTSATATRCCPPPTASTSSSATSTTSTPRRSRRTLTIPKAADFKKKFRAARRHPQLRRRLASPTPAR
jgi:hypothetical protein